MEMQITLVGFQNLQQAKKINLIDNQRNTICFQEIAVFENVKICVQLYTYSSCLHDMSTHPCLQGLRWCRWSGSSKHCSFILQLI